MYWTNRYLSLLEPEKKGVINIKSKEREQNNVTDPGGYVTTALTIISAITLFESLR